jgi:hypothetical protein
MVGERSVWLAFGEPEYRFGKGVQPVGRRVGYM